jgi:hypothetical protein
VLIETVSSDSHFLTHCRATHWKNTPVQEMALRQVLRLCGRTGFILKEQQASSFVSLENACRAAQGENAEAGPLGSSNIHLSSGEIFTDMHLFSGCSSNHRLNRGDLDSVDSHHGAADIVLRWVHPWTKSSPRRIPYACVPFP